MPGSLPIRGSQNVSTPKLTYAEVIERYRGFQRLLGKNMLKDSQERRFLPADRSRKLLSETEIRSFLKAMNAGYFIEYVIHGNRISDYRNAVLDEEDNTGAVKVFAISVLIAENVGDFTAILDRFKKHGFDDTHLPVLREPGQSLCEADRYCRRSCDHNFAHDCISRQDDQTWCQHPAVHCWDDWFFEQFSRIQWQFLAPEFTEQKFRYELHKEAPWPILGWDSQAFSMDDHIGHGFFSQVIRGRLIRGNYRGNIAADSRDPMYIPVALKEMTSGDARKIWAREEKAIGDIHRLGPDLRCVRRIGAVCRDKSFFLIFEYADGGNLRDVWDRKSPDLSAALVEETIEEVLGLSHALETIHGGRSKTGLAARASAPQVPSKDSSKGILSTAPLIDHRATSSEVPEIRVTESISLRLNNQVLDGNEEDDYGHFRYGDLKPDNILSFNRSHRCLGLLKLADFGLAKKHSVVTGERSHPTLTLYGTINYEAPEVESDQMKGKKSRFTDIWSMGCVLLELVVWLLYGKDGLGTFYRFSRATMAEDRSIFHETVPGAVSLSSTVKVLLRHLRGEDACAHSTALGELLNLIETKLLQTKTSPDYDSPKEGSRINARMLHEELDIILGKIRDPNTSPSYKFNGKAKLSLAASYKASGSRAYLDPSKNSLIDQKPPLHRKSTSSSVQDFGVGLTYRHEPINEHDWKAVDDETFARGFYRSISPNLRAYLCGTSEKGRKYCFRCRTLTFESGLSEKFDVSFLRTQRKHCDCCKLLYSALKERDASAEYLELERTVFGLRILGTGGRPFLSLLHCPGSSTALAVDKSSTVPIGFPRTLHNDSPDFFTLPLRWLRDCDENHASCKPSVGGLAQFLPTRLLDLGEDFYSEIRLVDSCVIQNGPPEKLRYIALSHPWGDPERHLHYKTTRDNIELHQTQIAWNSLPRTYTDAVTVARGLSIRYVWIDSLCIIQGSGGDFQIESSRMEEVFSSACLVIAASRATGTNDGFLRPRKHRDFVELPSGVFLAQFIDNFQDDVLRSHMSGRGWVFQERALARRSIFFAESQMYWECSHGIRCETLTRLTNNQAAFLGDANFPRLVASEPSKGAQIRHYEYFYKQYSRLGFSNPPDRPYGISGLEKRLTRALITSGGFGILQRHLGRTLLWQRDTALTAELSPIDFNSTSEAPRGVPSWSWMGYLGPIDFLDVPFDGVVWNTDDFKSPWEIQDSGPMWMTTNTAVKNRRFRVTTQSVAPSTVMYHHDTLVFDDSSSQIEGLECVVVARDRPGKGTSCYVLLVVPDSDNVHSVNCRRVGVGVLPMMDVESVEGRRTRYLC